MTSSISSNGVPLSSIFDAYTSGTKARVTGIKDNGQELSDLYAPLYLGTAASATGIESIGADLNTLYAAIGTVSYALPINGNIYSASVFTTGSSVIATLLFTSSTYGWVVKKNEAGTITTFATGSLPSGATKVKYTDIWLNAPGDTGTGSPFNAAPTFTTITTSALIVSDQVGASGGAGTRQSTHSINIEYQNSSGSTISNTTITFIVSADGE